MALLLLWMLAVSSYGLLSFPFSILALFVPLAFSAAAVVGNRRLKRPERVCAFRFGYLSCWHPYCTGFLGIAVLLIEFPNRNRFWETLDIVGLVLIGAIALWSLVYSFLRPTR